MPRLKLDRSLPKTIEEMTVARIQREGATASEALQYVMRMRRADRKVSEVCESAGLSTGVATRFLQGKGTPNLYTAELLAEACGYKLTLEVRNETRNTYVPGDDSYRMRIGDDSLDAD